MDRRSRRSAGRVAQGRGRGVRQSRAGTLVDDQRNAVRPAAPPQAGRADGGNAAVLGAAFGSPRLSSPGVARARRGVSYAGSFTRTSIIFLKAGRAWQAASPAFPLAPPSNRPPPRL